MNTCVNGRRFWFTLMFFLLQISSIWTMKASDWQAPQKVYRSKIQNWPAEKTTKRSSHKKKRAASSARWIKTSRPTPQKVSRAKMQSWPVEEPAKKTKQKSPLVRPAEARYQAPQKVYRAMPSVQSDSMRRRSSAKTSRRYPQPMPDAESDFGRTVHMGRPGIFR